MWRTWCETADVCGLIDVDCYTCPFFRKLDEDFYNSIDMFNKILKMNSDLSRSPLDTSDLKKLF